MKKHKVRKLELHKESLRRLDEGPKLQEAVGGATQPNNTCQCTVDYGCSASPRCDSVLCTASACPHSCLC
jgi:hypothetical protein